MEGEASNSITLPKPSADVLSEQAKLPGNKSAHYQTVVVICYHEDYITHIKEYMAIVKASEETCIITRVDTILLWFDFIIAPGCVNPLEGKIDDATFMNAEDCDPVMVLKRATAK